MPEIARKAARKDITACLEKDILKHPVYKRFAFNEIVTAHKTTESGETIGKNVLEIV